MDKKVIAALAIFILVGADDLFAEEIKWQDVSRGNSHVRAALVNPLIPRIIYAGSDSAVLKSEDAAQSWRPVLRIKGPKRLVNNLLFFGQDNSSVYALTGNGLFFSPNQGKSWKRIFKGRSELENECTTGVVFPGAIYLGTKAGLFISDDNGRRWHKAQGTLANSSISAIAGNKNEPNCIYAGVSEGVFKTEDAGKSWIKIFNANALEDNDDKDELPEDQDEEERIPAISCISIASDNLNYIYIATGRGVYMSNDRGKGWVRLSTYGLLSKRVRFLLAEQEEKILAVTRSGIFEFRESRWYELSLNLIVRQVYAIALDMHNNLYAACDRGLFKADITKANAPDAVIQAVDYLKNQPSIKEVQRAAIEYAEVKIEKIKNWRRQAQAKALLPKLSAGINRDTSDLWHWESGSSTKAYDDVLMRGRDTLGWDVTLSWDLGEVIWNSDQTSIDVRSRLLVQLREDILDEVTKLYFERVRVKMEMDELPLEERKKRADRQLRLEEVTAMLDGLTGGYFSSRVPNT